MDTPRWLMSWDHYSPGGKRKATGTHSKFISR
jgi:hypothetical protein